MYGPKVIGAGDDMDTDDLIEVMNQNRNVSEDEEEDNQEGMGDIEGMEGLEDSPLVQDEEEEK